MHFGGTYWLCVDHQLIVRSRVTLATLEKQNGILHMNPSQRVLFRNGGRLATGRLIDSDNEHCNIALSDGGTIISAKRDVALELTRTQIAALAPSFGIKAQDIETVIKHHSFSSRAYLELPFNMRSEGSALLYGKCYPWVRFWYASPFTGSSAWRKTSARLILLRTHENMGLFRHVEPAKECVFMSISPKIAKER